MTQADSQPPHSEREPRSVLHGAAALGATAVLTWFVIQRAGLGMTALRALDLSAWTPSWPILLGSSVILLAGYFTSAYQWGWIVEGLGGPRLPPLTSARIFMIANLGRYVPGKVWQIAGLAVLAKPFGVSAGTATAAALMGQGTALLGAALLGLSSIRAPMEGTSWRWALSAMLLVTVGLALLLPRVLRSVVRVWFRLARTTAPDPPGPLAILGWLSVGILSWVLYGGAFWVMVRGLGLEAPAVLTASAFAAAYVLGYLAFFAPAGIGVREGFLVAFLSPNLGPAVAGAVAVIARLWTTLVEILPAAAFWTHTLTTASEPNRTP